MQTEYFARDPLAWQIQPVTGMIVRTVGLVLCAASWWWLGAKGQESGSSGGIPMILAAHAVLIVAAIFLAKPLAGVLGDWASGLFMPGARHSCPQPMYSIPEGRMMAEDYSGALEAYAALAAEHPGEIAPHLRMMEIWLRVYQDADSARTVRDNALLSIKGRRNKERFRAAAQVILAEVGVET
jgi:hypothetical protein